MATKKPKLQVTKIKKNAFLQSLLSKMSKNTVKKSSVAKIPNYKNIKKV